MVPISIFHEGPRTLTSNSRFRRPLSLGEELYGAVKVPVRIIDNGSSSTSTMNW